MSPSTEKPKHTFKRLLPTDYFGIQNFMVSEGGMGLSGSNLMVFALVYSYSHNNDASDYYGSADYASARLGISRASVQAAFKALLEQELICIKGERKSKKGKPMKVYAVAEDAVDRAIDEFEAYWSAASIAYQPNYSRPASSPKIDNPQDVVVENPSLDNVQNLDIITNEPENDLDNVQKLDIKPGDYVQNLDIIIKGIDLDLKEDLKTNQPVEPLSSRNIAGIQDYKTPSNQVGRFSSLKPKHPHSEPLGHEIQSSFTALVERTKNRNRIKYAEVAYVALLAEGYTPTEVSKAWAARCHDALINDWKDSYHPQLTSFLEAPTSDPVGARAHIERYRKKRVAANPENPPHRIQREEVSPLEILSSLDGVFAALNTQAHQAARGCATAQILNMSAAARETSRADYTNALNARLTYLNNLTRAEAGLATKLAQKCLDILDVGREVSVDAS